MNTKIRNISLAPCAIYFLSLAVSAITSLIYYFDGSALETELTLMWLLPLSYVVLAVLSLVASLPVFKRPLAILTGTIGAIIPITVLLLPVLRSLIFPVNSLPVAHSLYPTTSISVTLAVLSVVALALYIIVAYVNGKCKWYKNIILML